MSASKWKKWSGFFEIDKQKKRKKKIEDGGEEMEKELTDGNWKVSNGERNTNIIMSVWKMGMWVFIVKIPSLPRKKMRREMYTWKEICQQKTGESWKQ